MLSEPVRPYSTYVLECVSRHPGRGTKPLGESGRHSARGTWTANLPVKYPNDH